MQIYYLLKCTCKWWRKCLGTSEDFKDLVEFKPCINCHGPRKFKCPKCAKIIKAVRVESPDPPETLVSPPIPPIEIKFAEVGPLLIGDGISPDLVNTTPTAPTPTPPAEHHFIGDVIVPEFMDTLPSLNETSAHELGLLIAKKILEAQGIKDASIQEKK